MLRTNVLILTAMVSVLVAPASSQAGIMTGPIVPIVPTGLNPGDKYHLAFVTAETRDATSSDIADYN